MRLSLYGVSAGLLRLSLAILDTPPAAAAASVPQVLLSDISATLAPPDPRDAVYHALNCQLGVQDLYNMSWIGYWPEKRFADQGYPAPSSCVITFVGYQKWEKWDSYYAGNDVSIGPAPKGQIDLYTQAANTSTKVGAYTGTANYTANATAMPAQLYCYKDNGRALFAGGDFGVCYTKYYYWKGAP